MCFPQVTNTTLKAVQISKTTLCNQETVGIQLCFLKSKNTIIDIPLCFRRTRVNQIMIYLKKLTLKTYRSTERLSTSLTMLDIQLCLVKRKRENTRKLLTRSTRNIIINITKRMLTICKLVQTPKKLRCHKKKLLFQKKLQLKKLNLLKWKSLLKPWRKRKLSQFLHQLRKLKRRNLLNRKRRKFL